MRVDHNIAAGQAFPIATDYLYDRFTTTAVLTTPIAANVVFNVDVIPSSLSVDQTYAALAAMVLMLAFVACRESAIVSRTFARRRTTTNPHRQIQRRRT